jgi:glycosyltransferase involved in cell wall biosynthesis
MKILHISTSDYGGAANATLRLHQGLLNAGNISKCLCLQQSNRKVAEVYGFERKKQTLFFRFLRKLGFSTSQADKNQRQIQGLEGKYEIFTFPNTDYDITKHPLVQEADLIHLHWVANFLDWPSFFISVKKPIVWTLHDMNPFQGGFHYADDMERNQKIFGKLELQMLDIKLKALKSVSSLTIITPSEWLTQASRNSAVLGRFPHQTIPYGLDTQLYRPLDKNFARQIFNLPQDKKLLLFVADTVANPRKGMDLLTEALRLLSEKDLVIVTIGGGNVGPLSDQQHIHLGRINDERLLTLAYSAADLFVIPSREDNLPNTVQESISCGTPVVGFQIGGIPDMLIEAKNGFLAPQQSPEALSQTLKKALDSNFDRTSIRKDAFKRYDQSVQAHRYLELYKEILSNHKNSKKNYRASKSAS